MKKTGKKSITNIRTANKPATKDFCRQRKAQPPSQSRVNGFAAPAALLTAPEVCAHR